MEYCGASPVPVRGRPRPAGRLSSAGGSLSELSILRAVYFRTPNFLGRTLYHPAHFFRRLCDVSFHCKWTSSNLHKKINKFSKLTHRLDTIFMFFFYTYIVNILSVSFPLKSSTNALKALSRTNPKPFSCNQKPRVLSGAGAGSGERSTTRRDACGSA